MAIATKTLNPIHFEDLEPHRFEDLVRQLVYDFRSWQRLEATGRSGGDAGFDVRGVEQVGGLQTEEDDNEDNFEAQGSGGDPSARTWLIQCKRETSIGPKKLLKYLDEIPQSSRLSTYGILFVASSDFSKRARDDFRIWCSENGLHEGFLWGRSELEDLLFQPKNDSLLFAYFGISLGIRRRTARTKISARIATKRKLKRLEQEETFRHFVLRDITDTDYPYLSEADAAAAPRDRRNRWYVAKLIGLTFRGAEFEVRRYFAFIDSEAKQWDVANAFDDARTPYSDPWNSPSRDGDGLREKIYETWSSFEPANRATLSVTAVLDFDRIVAIDEVGDDITENAHLFCRMAHRGATSLHRSLGKGQTQ